MFPSGKCNVFIETKSTISDEMVKMDDLRAKGFYETIFYYMSERFSERGDKLKYIIITNMKEWCIINSHEYDRIFWRNHEFNSLFVKFLNKQLSFTDRKQFYEKIAKYVNESHETIKYCYFNLFESTIKRDGEVKRNVDCFYRILSPHYLLKLLENNTYTQQLDRSFYLELLHIMGLEEVEVNNRRIIKRKKDKDRLVGSLIENTMLQIKSGDVTYIPGYIDGNTNEDKIFNAALQLTIIWINRLLFLKLLETQLVKYNNGNEEYKFLTTQKLKDFGEVDALFSLVLNVPEDERELYYKEKFPLVPYLNSSLFSVDPIEKHCLRISGLNNNITLPLFKGSTLSNYVKRIKRELHPVEYILHFLDSYNFGSDKKEDVNDKKLISASVLGLIFEKINGYKDGSIYTPPRITTSLTREVLERAVVNKFRESMNFSCTNMNGLYNELKGIDKFEANKVVNSIRICDPAVGSGHFLVSSLNEMIAIKSRLDILVDKDGKLLRDYSIEVENDELIIKDDNGIVEYVPSSFYKGSQRVQEVVFNEKRTIIENCLFGVDINKNSGIICCLRLWIELLKNTYYDRETKKLQTLPNIDINIKCGNSLISRYPIEIGKTLKLTSDVARTLKIKINKYKELVSNYKATSNKEERNQLSIALADIKRILRESNQASWLKNNNDNKFYSNSMEWMLEFPELLDDEARFIGFDVVIGNPPYINMQDLGDISLFYKNIPGKKKHEKRYQTYNSNGDILTLFYELGYMLVRTGGIVAYITSNSWMRTKYGEKTRKYLAEKTNPIIIIDFVGCQIFENVTVETNIIVFSKDENHNHTLVKNVTKADYSNPNYPIFSGFSYASYNSSAFWYIMSELDNKILEHVKKIGVELGSVKKWGLFVRRGVTLGKNDAFIIDGNKYNEILSNCTSDYELSTTKALIQKLIGGEDVQRYGYKWNDKYLITTFPSKKCTIGLLPAVSKHLESYEFKRLKKCGADWIADDPSLLAMFCRKKLNQDGRIVLINGKPVVLGPDPNKPEKARKKTNHKWFETSDNTAFASKLAKPKLIWKRIGNDVRFAYDETGIIPLDSCCFAIGKHIKYLCGIFNSSMGRYLLKFGPKTGNGDSLVSVQAFKPICIPIPNKNDEKTISEYVDKLSCNYDEEIVRKLNGLVYQIFQIFDYNMMCYIESKII